MAGVQRRNTTVVRQGDLTPGFKQETEIPGSVDNGRSVIFEHLGHGHEAKDLHFS